MKNNFGDAVDFALILFVLSLLTGILWAYDFFVARKKRKAEDTPPAWVEYGASFFPVILAVFMLRSFLVEPFRIPSGSMIPTLLVGDFILVNKFAYGIRLPVINKKVVEVGSPKRGDVMVFRYPHNPSQDYIKRVVGIPGDKVEYLNKQLRINGVLIDKRRVEDYLHEERLNYSQRYIETIDSVEHAILNDQDAPAYVPDNVRLLFNNSDACSYTIEGVSCTVPVGQYFMLGDNRDQSSDSRVWGFVPEKNIVGKAFFVWFHADSLLSLSGIRFDRIGSFK